MKKVLNKLNDTTILLQNSRKEILTLKTENLGLQRMTENLTIDNTALQNEITRLSDEKVLVSGECH